MLIPILKQVALLGIDVFEKPLEDYVELQTADIPYGNRDYSTSFVSSGRALITVLSVRGTRDIRSSNDRTADVARLVQDLKSQLIDPGYAIEFNYTRDPERGGAVIREQLRGARAAAASVGLELGGILSSQESHLASRTVRETAHIALWTLPIVMSAVERREALDAAREASKGWPGRGAKEAQNPFLALDSLRNRHEGLVSSVQSALTTVGVETEVLEVHDAGSDILENLWPGEDGSAFRLSLPGDPLPIRVPFDDDPSAILWPKIGRQLAVNAGTERVTPEIARFGSKLIASVDVVIGPEHPTEFGALRTRLQNANVPFRMSMRLRSGGARQMGWGAFLAPFAAIFGDANRRLMKSLDRARRVADTDGCVTWQASFSTWAPADQPAKIHTRLAELKRCVSQWGTMQVRSMSGDPIQGTLASVLGVSINSTAETGYAPLNEALLMMPYRAASPWKRGAVPFLTADGAIWPYEEGTTELPYTFTLIFAQMRAGKSALLARLVMGNILAAGSDRLPFIAFLDVGPGSSGVIDTLREALPPNRRNEVAHAKLKLDPKFSINILDPPLGCRTPPPDLKAMIEGAFAVLATPAESQNEAQEGLGSIIRRLLTAAYDYRDDGNPDGMPNTYTSGRDMRVDEAIARHRIPTTTEKGSAATWWKIVDALFLARDPGAAMLAQRFAVPTANDLVLVATNPSIVKDFESYTTRTGKPLLEMVVTELKNSLHNYHICSGVTRFEPAARVVAVDLQDVLGRGGGPTGIKQTAVMYTWVMVALTRRWWIEPRDVLTDPVIPQVYRAYHMKMAEDISSTPKLLVADEFHETTTSRATRESIVKLVRKGPKYRIRVILASQMLQDFDDDMRQLASVLVALSADDETVVGKICELWGLKDAHAEALRRLGKFDQQLGVPMFLYIKARSGVFSQLVYNCMSPIEIWAVATDPREVKLRWLLTEKVGFSRAVELLANFEPFRQRRAGLEIERRIQRNLEHQNYEAAEENTIISGIVAELVEIHRSSMRLKG